MIVLFVDIDYFFAQVEELLNPSLKGKPVAVCVYSGRTKDSGAIATSNYMARRLGIKAGMAIVKAKEIGKDVIFVPMRKDLYKEISDRVMSIVSTYGDSMEIASIDEAYVDVSRKARNLLEAMDLAKRLKEDILRKEGLRVTIGVGPNKVLAKIVAERNKPDGLGVVDNVTKFIDEIEISEVPGVGKKTEEILKERGIKTLRDVRELRIEDLAKLIGRSRASYLMSLAFNTYNEQVKPRQVSHRGRYVTLTENTRDINVILPFIKRAVDEAFSKINGLPMEIYVVAIMEDLDIVSKGKSYKFALTREYANVVSIELLKKIIESDRRKIRRIGVRLGKISRSSTLEDFLH
ncbi:MAG: DNA polymerase IV [Metallosphaera sp.]